jgi:hypothetical protein
VLAPRWSLVFVDMLGHTRLWIWCGVIRWNVGECVYSFFEDETRSSHVLDIGFGVHGVVLRLFVGGCTRRSQRQEHVVVEHC